MFKQFVISRPPGIRRFAVFWGEYMTEYLDDDPKSLKRCLGHLNLDPSDPVLFKKLQDAIDRFYRLEARSLVKFGMPKQFRIWRVDAKVLQIEFEDCYTEYRGKVITDAKLKRCLQELHANQLCLPGLRRELKEFLQAESKADPAASAKT